MICRGRGRRETGVGHATLFSQAVGFIIAFHGDMGTHFGPVYGTVGSVKLSKELFLW